MNTHESRRISGIYIRAPGMTSGKYTSHLERYLTIKKEIWEKVPERGKSTDVRINKRLTHSQNKCST